MEANLVPGMTYGSSYFPKSCQLATKLNYKNVVRLMIEPGLSRSKLNLSKRKLQISYQSNLISSYV